MVFRPFTDPQLSLESLRDDLGNLVQRAWHAGISMGPFDGQQWGPLVDMYEQADHYTLFAELPGVDANEIEVTHLAGSLTIRGEKRRPSSITEKDRPVRAERRYGAFSRTLDLPSGIDADRLVAKCTNGVLEITIPKSAGAKPKSVKVQAQQ
jgi:HSP20 family protein